MNNFRQLRRLLIALGTFSLVLSAHAQGPLNPPGPPAPTMKTLQQMEPRTDLATVPGDAAYHHIIVSPGSYYLSASLDVTKTHGIDVRAAGVTIDLQGFEIRRAAGSGGNGIEVDNTAHRAALHNGSIAGPFANGVRATSNSGRLRQVVVSGSLDSGAVVGDGWAVVEVTAFGNGGDGIVAGDGSVLRSCVAHDNTGDGIFAAPKSTVANCTARGNGGAGFIIGSVSAVTDCAAYGNGGDGFRASAGRCSFTNCTASENKGAYGISTGGRSVVTHCTATDNESTADESAGIFAGGGSTVIGCTASSNRNTSGVTSPKGAGIQASTATIRHCTVLGNQGDGIRVGLGALVAENNAEGNGNGGFGAGVHATAYSNRIEGNNVTGNDRGIIVEGGGNLIIRNSARLNTSNYQIAENNRYGQIFDLTATGSAAASGDGAAGTLTTTTHPWANFSY